MKDFELALKNLSAALVEIKELNKSLRELSLELQAEREKNFMSEEASQANKDQFTRTMAKINELSALLEEQLQQRYIN